ncbi:MAG: hypothetical protein JXR86_02910 [Spirochaetales bacterium]|nr:hypothetical protein [Spirochaetales bacterium]
MISKKELSAFILLIYSGALLAGQAAFFIKPADLTAIVSEPGTLVTRVFFVTSKKAGENSFDFDVKLPEGWRLVMGQETLELGPEAEEMTFLSFYIPHDAPAGIHELTYTVTNHDTQKELDYFIFPVEVLSRRDYDLELLEQPAFSIAGDTFRLSYRIRNAGNEEMRFILKGTAQDSFDFSMDKRYITLSPGESRTVNVFVETDPRLSRTARTLFRLEVIPEDDEVAAVSRAALVDVYPRVTGKEEPYHTIPATLAIDPVFEHGETDLFGIQLELSGKGSLDLEGNTDFSFFFKRPLNRQSQLTQEREEYRIELKADEWSVLLGDGYYSLSALTESSRFGRGVRVEKELGDFTLGSFYLMNEDSVPLFEETALYAGYAPSLKNLFALNYLNRVKESSEDFFSLEGHVTPHDKNVLDFEYAAEAGKVIDDSWSLSLGGSGERVSYRFKYLHSDPDFGGTNQDIDLFNSVLSFKLDRSLSFSATLGRTYNHLDREYPALQDYLQTRLNWKVNGETGLQAYWKTALADDRLPLPEKWYDSETLGIRFSRTVGKLKLNSFLEYGKYDDYEASEKLNIEKYGLSLDLPLGEKQSVNSSLSFTRDEADSLDKVFSLFSLSWSLSLPADMTLSLNYKTVNYRSSYFSGSDELNLGVRHRFSNDSTLSVLGRYAPPRESDDKTAFSLNVEYRTPLEIPVFRRDDIERLEGTVFYGKTGEPIPNVILRIGSSVAISDSYGRFVFHSLKPGDYEIYLDGSSLDETLITADEFPQNLKIKSREENHLDVVVIESSTIAGQVSVYEPKRILANYESGEREYEEPYGLSGVLIELSQGDDVKYAVTDSRGRFFVSRLRPGIWNIRADNKALPENHYFEKDEITVELDAEDEEKIEIRVFSRVRSIIFIDEDDIQEMTEELSDSPTGEPPSEGNDLLQQPLLP